jgi:hypothetical protein
MTKNLSEKGADPLQAIRVDCVAMRAEEVQPPFSMNSQFHSSHEQETIEQETIEQYTVEQNTVRNQSPIGIASHALGPNL